jgi:hypothetical protein
VDFNNIYLLNRDKYFLDNLEQKHKMLIKKIDPLSEEILEFILKVREECDDTMLQWFSGDKWIYKNYEYVLGIIHENDIVGISCAKSYERWHRIGTPQYVLKKYRNMYRNSLLRSDGFLDQHLKESNKVFFSIHAYNRRMKLHAENFYKRTITVDMGLKHLDKIHFCGIHQFHKVEQYIFSYGDQEDLLEVIKES